MAESIVSGQTYLFLNWETRMAMDLFAGNPADQTAVISSPAHAATPNNQLWKVTAIDSQFYTLTNVASGTVLDLAYGSSADGAVIQGYHYHGSANQQWQFAPAWDTGRTSPAWFILNRAGSGNSMVTSKDGDMTPGVKLVSWNWTSSGEQDKYMRWIVIPVQPK